MYSFYDCFFYSHTPCNLYTAANFRPVSDCHRPTIDSCNTAMSQLTSRSASYIAPGTKCCQHVCVYLRLSTRVGATSLSTSPRPTLAPVACRFPLFSLNNFIISLSYTRKTDRWGFYIYILRVQMCKWFWFTRLLVSESSHKILVNFRSRNPTHHIVCEIAKQNTRNIRQSRRRTEQS